MNIEKEIKKIMIDEDVSINELAARMDTTRQNISRILNSNTDYKVSVLSGIANVLGYDVKIEFVKRGE